MKYALLALIASFTALSLWFMSHASKIYSQSEETSVSATIRISVCGDGVAESPEECDGSDLDGISCESLGFVYGSTTCDIACDIDSSACWGTPTPTPTPSTTPTPAQSGSSGSSSTTSTTSSPSVAQTTPISPIPQELLARFILPPPLSIYDIDQNGVIDEYEMITVARRWSVFWKNTGSQNCDINLDGVCDLTDFSVLMYYVGRSD